MVRTTGRRTTSRRKEEGNCKEKEDKDSSWTCVVGLVDGGGTSLVVQLGEHSCKSYDNQTGIKDNEDDRRTDSNRMQIAWRSSRMGIGGG